jgi:hypothetical protein
LLGFFTDRSQGAIDRVGVHGPRIVALGKINQKRYEILEVGVVQRVGLAEIAAEIEFGEPDAAGRRAFVLERDPV